MGVTVVMVDVALEEGVKEYGDVVMWVGVE